MRSTRRSSGITSGGPKPAPLVATSLVVVALLACACGGEQVTQQSNPAPATAITAASQGEPTVAPPSSLPPSTIPVGRQPVDTDGLPLRLAAQTPRPTLTLAPKSGPPGTSFAVSGGCPPGGGTVVTQLLRDGIDVGEGSSAGPVGNDGAFSVRQRIPSIRTSGATAGDSEFYQPGAQYAVTARCPDGFEFAAQPFNVIAPRTVALTG